MLNFSFTDEQNEFRETLRNFAKREITPRMSHWDENREYPKELVKKIAKMGALGLRTAKKYGGHEKDHITMGIAIEEIGRGDFILGFPVTLSELAGSIIESYGTEQQKQEWLPNITSGEKVVTIALTELHAGSDAQKIKTTATLKGDHYVLNGYKAAIDLYISDAVIIFAKTDPEKGAKGISTFLIPGDTPGVKRFPLKTIGCKGALVGNIELNEVVVPASAMLGNINEGFYQVMKGFDCSRVMMGLWCLGAAQGALTEATEYAKKREAFGKPLAKFEGVSFPLVENYTLIEAARLLCYKTLWLRDQGLPHTKEAAMCKWWIPKLSSDIAQHAMDVQGWRGYTDICTAGQRMRDIMGLHTGDGAIEVMKLILVREILGKEYLPYV